MMTPNRRSSRDRRRRPTPAFSRYLVVGGRRRDRRRADDPASFYVDRLGPELWVVLLAIFLLQILDANLTIAHLRKGGTELNPFMSFLIDRGENLFLGVKLGLSAVGLAFLGVHKNFPMVKRGLAVIFCLFLGVVGWHLIVAFSST
jgi:hypothetical protein